tara:strand:+ start:112 stop:441 length:330 start_codon:yes stop_codon:yes gene_type:complete
MPGIEIKGRSKRANYRHGSSPKGGGYQDSSAKAMPKYFSANKDYYPSGGVPIRVGAKRGGGDDHWIQDATKNMRTDKPCTGKKFGSKTCPPGSKRYNLAKTFKAMNKKG